MVLAKRYFWKMNVVPEGGLEGPRGRRALCLCPALWGVRVGARKWQEEDDEEEDLEAFVQKEQVE